MESGMGPGKGQRREGVPSKHVWKGPGGGHVRTPPLWTDRMPD